ncbi:hypothetical protein ACVWZA_000323 [Sphingomonas sp. UYAg733]
MYMAPIVAAKAPASTTARRVVGAIVLPLCAAVMLPFLAVYALYAGTVLALRAIPKTPRALLDAVDYAGSVALGR